MHYLDQTWSTAAENLAVDEALLDAAEAGETGEVLRFWEARDPFVVLGHSNRLERETFSEACAKLNVPILRRCSGGGAVLQAPGVLSYALILGLAERPELENVTSANRHIMTTNAAALSELLRCRIQVRGITDLALNNRKVSGNSQRRRRHFILFHGTLLLKPDLGLMEQLLRMPSRKPDYRDTRSHSDFLGAIPAQAEDLKTALRHAWNATSTHELKPSPARVAHLVAAKYTLNTWNRKF
jgi:lipoate-protein ligase A